MTGYRSPISQAILPLQFPHDLSPEGTRADGSLPFYQD